MGASPALDEKVHELGKEINSLISNAARNIEKVKSAYKKAEYKQNLRGVADRIISFYDRINTRIVPLVAMRREMETIDARAIVWQINVISC